MSNRQAGRKKLVGLFFIIILVAGLWIVLLSACTPQEKVLFDGREAYQHVVEQMKLGPRPTGSTAWQAEGDYIVAQLERFGWQPKEQTFDYKGTRPRNITACRGSGPVTLLGAHYDTRMRADQDKKDPSAPAPGANDGASGVAVLLELARTMNVERLHNQVCLAFFDAEDNGKLDGWEWIVGSNYMADHMDEIPAQVIVIDMIGDADQQIYFEKNSDPQLRDKIWKVAANLGYERYFIPQARHTILDDHLPFLQKGIPAIDIIDFNYPYWHTAQDTLDKVSPESLSHVGRTLQVYLEGAR
jgi:glutaminyl-peptide cyclotransferase